MPSLVREISHVEPYVSEAITRIKSTSPRLSRSAVISILLSESPRIIAETKPAKKPHP